MSHASIPSRGSASSSMWPTAPSGWFALIAALVGLGSWIVLPIVTTLYRDTYPVTDTVVMPIIGTVLVALAAIVNVVALWLGRQRSGLNVIFTVLTLAGADFFGLFVIGEGLGGA